MCSKRKCDSETFYNKCAWKESWMNDNITCAKTACTGGILM